MSKFCSKCGAEIQDDVKFCAGCGASTEEVAAKTTKKSSKITLIAILAVVGVLVIALIIILCNVIFGGYKSTLKSMIKSTENTLTADLSSVMTYGKDIEVSVDFKDEKKIDKDDLETIQEYLEIQFDGKQFKGADKIKITNAYLIEIESTCEGSEDDEDMKENFLALKLNGDWVFDTVPVECKQLDEYIEILEFCVDNELVANSYDLEEALENFDDVEEVMNNDESYDDFGDVLDDAIYGYYYY